MLLLEQSAHTSAQRATRRCVVAATLVHVDVRLKLAGSLFVRSGLAVFLFLTATPDRAPFV